MCCLWYFFAWYCPWHFRYRYFFQVKIMSIPISNGAHILRILFASSVVFLSEVETRYIPHQEKLSKLRLFQPLPTTVEGKLTQSPFHPRGESREFLQKSIISKYIKPDAVILTILESVIDTRINEKNSNIYVNNFPLYGVGNAANNPLSAAVYDNSLYTVALPPINTVHKHRAKRAEFEKRRCDVICHACAALISRRWSALCHVQCFHEGGQALDACVMLIVILGMES